MELIYKPGGSRTLIHPELQRVYLLWGAEDELKSEAARAIVDAALDPDFADFDQEVLDGSSATVAEILAAAGQAPFGSPRRVVEVRGMETWRDRARQTEVERLAEGVASLPETACLLLLASADEEEGRRKVAITVKLNNAVKKHGALVQCGALQAKGLDEWVAATAAREGKQFSPGAAARLIEAVGTEMRPLEQEILKLVCFVGDRGAITADDVARVVCSSPDDALFGLKDAIAQRRTDAALSLLSELHRYDPKPQAVAGKLIAVLSRHYRTLWQAKYLVEKRISPRDVRSLPEAIALELPDEGSIAQVAFRAGELMSAARGTTWEEIETAMENLLLCDLANKGGVTDESDLYNSEPVNNLQILVLLLTRGGSAARAPAAAG